MVLNWYPQGVDFSPDNKTNMKVGLNLQAVDVSIGITICGLLSCIFINSSSCSFLWKERQAFVLLCCNSWPRFFLVSRDDLLVLLLYIITKLKSTRCCVMLSILLQFYRQMKKDALYFVGSWVPQNCSMYLDVACQFSSSLEFSPIAIYIRLISWCQYAKYV